MTTPSPLQRAIYEDVANGRGHVVVRARAGTGKTTTIMGALSFVPRGSTVALFAFSKTIAEELAERAPRHVEVKTLHSHGFSCVKRAFRLGKDAFNDGKTEIIARRLFGSRLKNHPVRGFYPAMSSLLAKAKDTLVKLGDEEALDELIDRFGIDCPTEAPFDLRTCLLCEEADPESPRCPEADLDEFGILGAHVFPDPSERERVEDEYGFVDERSPRAMFVEAAMTVLRESARDVTMVDYADMCWLPVVRSLRPWAYDRVFVDETQDLSPSQIELLLKCCRPGGRICVIGDDRQAIYAFRGADADTIPNLIARLKARVLPLSVTYRCCRAVVDLARREVPDYEASPSAEQGHVGAATFDELVSDAAPGDMIVSRSNAPLMPLCLKLLARGKRAAIKGSDVGEGLIAFMERFEVYTVPDLLLALGHWRDQEMARLAAAERDTSVVTDRYECVLALTEGMETVSDVAARARRLFAPDKGLDTARLIVLGTTHKLKGLEAERVWMLEDTYRRERGGEEANCWYVAVTRAKSSLFLARRPKEEVPSCPL